LPTMATVICGEIFLRIDIGPSDSYRACWRWAVQSCPPTPRNPLLSQNRLLQSIALGGELLAWRLANGPASFLT